MTQEEQTKEERNKLKVKDERSLFRELHWQEKEIKLLDFEIRFIYD